MSSVCVLTFSIPFPPYLTSRFSSTINIRTGKSRDVNILHTKRWRQGPRSVSYGGKKVSGCRVILKSEFFSMVVSVPVVRLRRWSFVKRRVGIIDWDPKYLGIKVERLECRTLINYGSCHRHDTVYLQFINVQESNTRMKPKSITWWLLYIRSTWGPKDPIGGLGRLSTRHPIVVFNSTNYPGSLLTSVRPESRHMDDDKNRVYKIE